MKIIIAQRDQRRPRGGCGRRRPGARPAPAAGRPAGAGWLAAWLFSFAVALLAFCFSACFLALLSFTLFAWAGVRAGASS